MSSYSMKSLTVSCIGFLSLHLSSCSNQDAQQSKEKSVSNSEMSSVSITSGHALPSNDADGSMGQVNEEQSRDSSTHLDVNINATEEETSEQNSPLEFSQNSKEPSDSTDATEFNWNVVLMASDQGNRSSWIQAFDNARVAIRNFLTGKGISLEKIRQMSLHPDQQSETVKPTSTKNFIATVKALNSTGPNDACLVHMTSHGSRDGFNIGYERLTPADLDAALTAGCGMRPTVVLISACYSGLYVLESSGVRKPNRIILTAARYDRTSFGCSPENQYTYWDSCLIEHLPKVSKFKDLAKNINDCIVAKEGGSTSSFPQAFIGSEVADLSLPSAGSISEN